MKPNAKEMAAIVTARNKKTNRKKPTPVTAGKKIAKSLWFSHNPEKQERDVGRRIDRAIARAIARAMKAEMERCAAIVLYVAPHEQHRWICNGWDPRKEEE